MYQLIARLTAKQMVVRQIPALVLSIVVAEFFYKFHSFTLECVAFLATWFVIDTVMQFVARQLRWTWATDLRPVGVTPTTF